MIRSHTLHPLGAALTDKFQGVVHSHFYVFILMELHTANKKKQKTVRKTEKERVAKRVKIKEKSIFFF